MKDYKQKLKLISGFIEMLSIFFLSLYPVLSFSGVTTNLKEIALFLSLLGAIISLSSHSFRSYLLKDTLWGALTKAFLIFFFAFILRSGGLPVGSPEWMSHFFFK
jgi:hypothetical protein